MAMTETTKPTVVILGASYGGDRAAKALVEGIGDVARIIVVDKKSHHNHIYVFPRYAVTDSHEHKAFIPYSDLEGAHLTLHGSVVEITDNTVKLDRTFEQFGLSDEIHYDYLVYALGSTMPKSLQMDAKTMAGTKQSYVEWLRHRQGVIKTAQRVVIAGGGALGVQFATDIAERYPTKRVTIIHSRDQLLPRFDPQMHNIIYNSMKSLNIDVHLNERISLDNTIVDFDGNVSEKRVFTQSGKEFDCDLLLLCTGQRPNSEFMETLAPDSVDKNTKLIKVTRSMQLASQQPSESTNPSVEAARQASEKSISIGQDPGLHTSAHPNIYVIGDSADAFGAIKSGRYAWFQAQTAAENIIKQIRGDTESQPTQYDPGEPAIKVSIGLSRTVVQMGNEIVINDNVPEDLDAASVWRARNIDTSDMSL